MAASLIDTMTEDFDPSLYKDAYREALEALVQAKIEGNELVSRRRHGISAEKPGGPADLTETLRASVAAAKANRAKDGGEPGDGKAAPAQALVFPPEGERVTGPIPHWPGRTVIPRRWRAGVRRGDASRPFRIRAKSWCCACTACRERPPTGPTSWPNSRRTSTARRSTCPAPGSPRRRAAKRGYSITALAGTVIRLIEALDRGPVHLVGQLDGRRGLDPGGGPPPGPGADADPGLAGAARPADPAGAAALPGRRRCPSSATGVMRRTQRVPAENRVAGRGTRPVTTTRPRCTRTGSRMRSRSCGAATG